MTRGPDRVEAPGPPPFWLTGTDEDQFIAVYMAMASPGKYHPPIPPPMVDLMDLSTIAALMGAGEEEAQQREVHEQYRAPGPIVPMVRKPRTEDT